MSNYDDDVEFVELLWNCKDCGSTGILGRHKRCLTCGSPREANEMDMDGLDEAATAPVVRDPKLLELATAGADWFCECCGSGNRGDITSCVSCAAPRGSKPKPPPRPTPSTSYPAYTPPSEPKPPTTPKPEPKPKPEPMFEPRAEYKPEPSNPLPVIAAIMGFVGVTAFAMWAVSSHQVVGKVSAMTWSRSVTVQAWTQTKERQWRHKATERTEKPPINGAGERAGYQMIPDTCREEHYEDERYACGTEPEDYDCSYDESYTDTCSYSDRVPDGKDCKKKNNGFAECRTKYKSVTKYKPCTKSRRIHKTCTRQVTKYCYRPIFRTKCDYATQEWRVSRSKTVSGTGVESVNWPDMNLTSLEREQRSGEYILTFAYTDGKDETAVRKVEEADYLNWRTGQDVYLDVTNMGRVDSYSDHPTEK